MKNKLRITKDFVIISAIVTGLAFFAISCSRGSSPKRVISGIPQGFSDGLCNWGTAGPQRFQCRGKTYVYGIISCSSGFTEDVFCEEQYSYSGQACKADTSPDTVACHSLLPPSGSPPHSPPGTSPGHSNEFCNWGFAGPQRFHCRGKTYIYGVVSCVPSGVTGELFCEEQYVHNGPACKADNSPDTVACHSLAPK